MPTEVYGMKIVYEFVFWLFSFLISGEYDELHFLKQEKIRQGITAGLECHVHSTKIYTEVSCEESLLS